MTATKQYDAFGNLTSSSGSSVSPFGFAGGWGYQEDQDSGLKLLGHRYYDSSTGRFLTRDPAMAGRNWYGYCENNPLRWADPQGCDVTKIEEGVELATDAADPCIVDGVPALGSATGGTTPAGFAAVAARYGEAFADWFFRLPPAMRWILASLFGIVEQVGNDAGYGPACVSTPVSVLEGEVLKTRGGITVPPEGAAFPLVQTNLRMSKKGGYCYGQAHVWIDSNELWGRFDFFNHFRKEHPGLFHFHPGGGKSHIEFPVCRPELIPK